MNKRHLIIKKIGPLDNVDILLSRINLIIGPQSAGKSCILKIASFCAWLEKSIEESLNKDIYLSRQIIDKHLIAFYNLEGYVSEDSFFAYETDTMKFSFSFKDNSSTFEWGKGRWYYKQSKIAYIIAERNILSVVPNWFEMNFPNNSIRNFLTEWQNARNYAKGKSALPILNMGIGYRYDNESGTDKILLENGSELKLNNVSSGLQSLVPLFILADYMAHGIYSSGMRSVKDQEAALSLYKKLEKEYPESHSSESVKETLQQIMTAFTTYDHSDIYLEEPEENLFPETQKDLVNWLAEILNEERKHSLFIATHSPYIMSAFNNLIQAGNVIEESPEKIEKVNNIIGENRFVKYDDVAAFAISNGTIHHIMDDEFCLISAEALDGASEDIARDFDNLLNV